MAKHVVAVAGDVAPGSRKLVNVKGRQIVIFNQGGEYFALLNKCPHEGAQLCFGRLVSLLESDEPGTYRHSRHGEMLKCPWHGWEFDIRTGQSYCAPDSTFVRTYSVTVEPGESLAKGPFMAETFPVSVEGSYLVVEL